MDQQTRPISIDLITTDAGTQMREALDEDAVSEYAEVWAAGNGDRFPPLDAVSDGAFFWLTDGFHRLAAAIKAGRSSVPVRITPGFLPDAILAAIRSNQLHGVKRTNADKRRAVLALLKLKQAADWSIRQVAEEAGVSHTFASRLKQEVEKPPEPEPEQEPAAKSSDTKPEAEDKPPSNPKRSRPKAASDPFSPSAPDEENEEERGEEPEPKEEPEKEPEPDVQRSQFETDILEARSVCRSLKQDMGKLMSRIRGLEEATGLEAVIGSSRAILDHLGHAQSYLAVGTPEAVCPRCAGQHCAQCANYGWVNSSRLKELRD